MPPPRGRSEPRRHRTVAMTPVDGMRFSGTMIDIRSLPSARRLAVTDGRVVAKRVTGDADDRRTAHRSPGSRECSHRHRRVITSSEESEAFSLLIGVLRSRVRPTPSSQRRTATTPPPSPVSSQGERRPTDSVLVAADRVDNAVRGRTWHQRPSIGSRGRLWPASPGPQSSASFKLDSRVYSGAIGGH
jgi:hypothetical protein